MEKELDIRATDIISFIYKEFKILIIIFLSFFMLGVCIILSVNNFKYPSYVSKYTFSIENPLIQEYLTPYYLINKKNFLLASEKSKIKDLDISESFLSSFSVIPGEIVSNTLLEYLNKEDFNALAKKIAVQPEFLDDYFNDINEHSLNYKTIRIDRDRISLSSEQIDIFVSNLVYVINEELNRNFNLSPIKLSELSYDNTKEKSSFEKTIYIREYLKTLRHYVDKLLEFTNTTTLMNLNQLDNNLVIIETQYNEYLSTNSDLSQFIISNNNIKIASLDRQIEFLQELINTFKKTNYSSGNNQSNEQNADENVIVDSDAFSKILEIGSELSSIEAQIKYTDILYTKNLSKLDLLEENELYRNPSNYYELVKLSSINEMIKEITDEINVHLDSLSNMSDHSQAIKLLSNPVIVKTNFLTQILQSLIILFFVSLIISIVTVLIKGSLRRFNL